MTKLNVKLQTAKAKKNFKIDKVVKSDDFQKEVTRRVKVGLLRRSFEYLKKTL